VVLGGVILDIVLFNHTGQEAPGKGRSRTRGKRRDADGKMRGPMTKKARYLKVRGKGGNAHTTMAWRTTGPRT
jgi:hypothetical protein